jgi:hypothetical protein
VFSCKDKGSYCFRIVDEAYMSGPADEIVDVPE